MPEIPDRNCFVAYSVLLLASITPILQVPQKHGKQTISCSLHKNYEGIEFLIYRFQAQKAMTSFHSINYIVLSPNILRPAPGGHLPGDHE
jgi:hypothetical protein